MVTFDGEATQSATTSHITTINIDNSETEFETIIIIQTQQQQQQVPQKKKMLQPSTQ